jgi:hypothetical protein
LSEQRKLKSLLQVREATRRIRIWQADPVVSVLCPLCDAPGLTIEDRSARPVCEWFVLSCRSCRLEDTVQIPLSPLSP